MPMLPKQITQLLAGDEPAGRRRIALEDRTLNLEAMAKRLYDEWEAQYEFVMEADEWLQCNNEVPNLPKDQWVPDHQALLDVAAAPYIRVAIAEMTQCLYVEGHIPTNRKPGTRESSDVWKRIWQANRMDARQIAVHRNALAHGVAYVMCERSTDPLTGEETIGLRGISALSGCALWRPGAIADFPEQFIEVQTDQVDDDGKAVEHIRITDSDETHIFRHEPDSEGRFEYVTSEQHGAGVVPVVAFANDEDLDGRTLGEVRPMIPILKRLDQDTFDRLIVQRHGSWRIRTAAGVQLRSEKGQEPTEEDERYLEHLRLTDLLASENPQARFGTLEPTPLDGYIAARDADLRDFATILQIPPHHILGLSPNVSAEGLVEAQAGLMRKMEERQHLFGEAWELVMRLAAHMLGMKDAAADFTAQVTWRDMESRSLAQIADALGKVATMLEVPPELLWNRLPNWTQQDTEAAQQRREEIKLEQEMMALIESGGAGPSGDTGGGGGGSAGSYQGGGARGSGIDDAERRRINRIRGGYGPDWDGDGKPN